MIRVDFVIGGKRITVWTRGHQVRNATTDEISRIQSIIDILASKQQLRRCAVLSAKTVDDDKTIVVCDNDTILIVELKTGNVSII